MNNELLSYMNKIEKKEFAMPYHIELHPTTACNQDCVWCIMREQREDHAGTLSKEQLFKIACQIAGNDDIKVVFLSGGGDPLVNEHLFEEYEYDGKKSSSYFELLTKVGVQIAISTNGEYLNRIIDCNGAKYISSLRVSVDAGTEEQYANLHRSKKKVHLADVIHNIERFYEVSEKKVEISYLLHERNMDGYVKLAELFNLPEAVSLIKVKHLLGDIDRFGDRRESIVSNGITIVFEKEKEIPEGYYASQTSLLINSVGEVYPCCHMVDYGNQYLMGNVSEKNLHDIFSESFNMIKGLYCERCAGLEINRVFHKFHLVKKKLGNKMESIRAEER